MDNWYFYALVATLSYGFFNFIQKIAAEKGLNSSGLIQVSSITVFFCSLLSILYTGYHDFEWPVIIGLAILNSSLFFSASILKLEALKRSKAFIIFPITKMNALVAALLGLFIFAESPSAFQWVGMGLTIFSILILTSKTETPEKKQRIEDKSESIVEDVEPNRPRSWIVSKFRSNTGVIFALAGASCTGVTAIVGKLAAVHTDKLMYMLLSYFLVFTYSSKFRKSSEKKSGRKFTLCFGVMIGILNFVGYLALLTSYRTGEVSVIQPIFSTSIVIPIVLSAVVFKERMTTRQILAVFLTIISIVLLKVS